MINWDDMRIFIAVAQSGSFSNAGRRIGMDASTVARRIDRLESALNATLFVRHNRGLVLTAAGVRLAQAGAGVEAAMEMAREEAGTNAMAGTVRLSVGEGFGGCILAGALPAFLKRRPGMRIELVATAGYLSSKSRQVDLAITSSPPSASRLIVEKLSDYELGLYASPEYLEKHGTPRNGVDLHRHCFVGYMDDMIYSDQLRFLDAFEPKLPRRLSSTSVRLQMNLVEAGGGVGAFPHFIVPPDSNLVRILPELQVVRSFWMAIHAELYNTARIRAVRFWLAELVAENQHRLTPGADILPGLVARRPSPAIAPPALV